MFCQKCGTQQTNSNSNFCGGCGSALNNQTLNQTIEQNAQVNNNQSLSNQPDSMVAPENQINNFNNQINDIQQPVGQVNPVHQEFSNINQNIQNNPYPNQANTNFNNNGNQNINNGFVNWIPLILAISALVFFFINEYIGLLLGISAIVTSIKIKSSHSKKSKIIGIIATVLCALYIIGTFALGILGFNVSDKDLNGEWFCLAPHNLANINSTNMPNIWSNKTFNNGQYTFELGGNIVDGEFVGGTTRSGRYTIQPSAINQHAWESVKGSLEKMWDLTDETPLPFMLTTDEGPITAVKIYTTTGHILMVYTGNDSYVCWKSGTENDQLFLNDNDENNINTSRIPNNNNTNNSALPNLGTWNCTPLQGSEFIESFIFNADRTFTWRDYRNPNTNYSVGTFEIVDLQKTNHSRSHQYYEVTLNSTRFVVEGENIEQTSGNIRKFEMGIGTKDAKGHAVMMNQQTHQILDCYPQN